MLVDYGKRWQAETIFEQQSVSAKGNICRAATIGDNTLAARKLHAQEGHRPSAHCLALPLHQLPRCNMLAATQPLAPPFYTRLSRQHLDNIPHYPVNTTSTFRKRAGPRSYPAQQKLQWCNITRSAALNCSIPSHSRSRQPPGSQPPTPPTEENSLLTTYLHHGRIHLQPLCGEEIRQVPAPDHTFPFAVHLVKPLQQHHHQRVSLRGLPVLRSSEHARHCHRAAGEACVQATQLALLPAELEGGEVSHAQ